MSVADWLLLWGLVMLAIWFWDLRHQVKELEQRLTRLGIDFDGSRDLEQHLIDEGVVRRRPE